MAKWTEKNSQRIDALFDIALQWIKRSLLSPLTSVVTKSLLYVGASIMAWPLIENIIISGILKNALGFDLGIKPPGVEAFVTGLVLMLSGALYSYKVYSKTADREMRIVDANTSVLSTIWVLCGEAVKQSTNLVSYYPTQPADIYKKLETAFNVTYEAIDLLKKHRPFILPESIYLEAMALAEKCEFECRMFDGYLRNLKSPSVSFTPHQALKEAEREYHATNNLYESLCKSIRNHINSIRGSN